MSEEYNTLKERFEDIRDERGLQRNTATRIGRAFLDLLDYLRSNVDGKFISKISNDTANGVITFAAGLVSNAIAWFKQGIKIGSSADSTMGIDANGNATLNNVTAESLVASVLKTPGFAEAVGLAGKGFGVTAGQDGRATLQTDDLIVLGRMLVNSLNVREVTYIGGVYLLTPAGSTVAAVAPLYGEEGEEQDTRLWTTDGEELDSPVVVGYRLYWLADNGTTATMNFWQQGDQAYCQTFNIEAGVHENVSNSLWWRLVVGVGTDADPLGDGKDYHYADVADTDIVLLFDSEDEPVTGDGGSLSFIGKGSSYAFVQNGLNSYTAPVVGDKAVCLGSQTSSNRRGAIQLNTEGEASIGIYDGINNFDNLSTHEVHFLSKSEVRMSSRRFRWTTATGASTPPIIYRGDWTQGSTSYYYDEWDFQGSRWLCIFAGDNDRPEGITCEPGTVPQGDTTHSWTYYWKKISLKGEDGKSVNIAGYADYLHGVDWNGNARPQTVTETEVGLIDLLDYHSTQEDMIEVGEEGESDWQAYSVPLGTCYILKGTNHLYEATENGWLDLGKFKGEDGAPAPFYTEEWYAWSNDASTANATTSPNIGNNSWEHYIPEQGSYAYLWKKTVRWEWNSTLKIYRAGNPQYYRLSGTNGTSIAVKGHVATTSNLPATHSDGDAYVVDADGHLYMWSDEANQWLDIGQFQGENGRAYYVHIAWATNVVYSEQTGEVTRVDGFVIAKTPDDDTHYWMGVLVNENSSTDSNDALLYTWSYTKGVNGTSPWIADLDNEMDSVACDADGHPVQINGSNQSVSSNFKLFHGSSEEKFYISSVSPSSRTGVTIAATPTTKANAAMSGSLTVTYNGSGDNRATIDGKDEFTIELTADSDSNIKRQLTFTVNGVRPGADGEDATIYSIKPTVNSIAFARDANGNLTPNEVSFYLECEKSQGGTITNPAISHVGIVRYSTSAPPADKDAGTAWGTQESDNDKLTFSGGVATVSNGAAFNQIYIALFAADGTLYDRETVPIARDGAKGTDGNTIRTVTVYKQSDTQPATPTGDTIPPSRWSITPGYFANGVIPGDGDNDIFVAHTISFVTTKANQKIKVRLESETEEDYDFVICGSVDETLDENELNAENLSQDDELRESYNAISGNDYNAIVLVVPNAGSHFIQVAYTKDRSQSATGDCGRYWVGFFDMPIWASIATFNGNTKVDGWSTPVRWNGTDGADGEDGLDAWTLTVNPNPVIIEQDIDTGNFPFPMYIDFTAKCGNGTATVGTPTNVDNDLNLDVRPDNSGNHRLKIIGYSKTGNTYVTAGKITCSVQLSYNGRTTTMQVAISVGVTLLAEWETKISDGVETSVATKLGFTDSGGDIVPLTQVGQYIRGWAENTSRLTETVGSTNYGNNLFGFSKGIIYDGAVPFVQGYGFVATYDNGYQYGRIYNLDLQGKAGYYVVSCEIKVQSATNINIQLGDQNPVGGSGLVDDNGVKKVPATTSWQKIVAIFSLEAQYAVDSNGALIIRGGSTSNNAFIRYLQIEHGSMPSAFGICSDDAANNSEPMNVAWSQSPESGMFSDETSGNYGPGGTPEYTTNRVYPSISPQYPEGTGYIELIKSDLVMSAGVYTLSFWARASVNESVMECFIYDATDTQTFIGALPIVDALGVNYGELDPDQTEGMNLWGTTNIRLTTAWKKYYVHWYLTGESSKISVIPIRINGSHTGGSHIDYYIAQIKLERGYVTSANRTEYQTVMRQTARNIDFSVLVNSMEKAGIHLYTEAGGTPDNENETTKGIIELNADNVRVSNDLTVKRLLTNNAASKPRVEIYEGNLLFFGSNGKKNIELTTDGDGNAQLNFYDADGNLKYGLGPSTIFDNIEVSKNTWQQRTWASYGTIYNSAYSQSKVAALADDSITMSTYWQFFEGFKKVGNTYEYNIGVGSNKNIPSNYDRRVFTEQNYGATKYLADGVYIGEKFMMFNPTITQDENSILYERRVYQIITNSQIVQPPVYIGSFYILVPKIGTAVLADNMGEPLECSTSETMGYYMINAINN